jgi:hypothetical protein
MSWRITNELNVCKEWPSEPSHTSSPSIYSTQLKSNCYVQFAHVLRTHGRSAPQGRTVRRTYNDYFSRLKSVRAIRKARSGLSANFGRTVRDLATWSTRALSKRS